MNSDAIGVFEGFDRPIDRLAIPAGDLAQPVAAADVSVVMRSGSTLRLRPPSDGGSPASMDVVQKVGIGLILVGLPFFLLGWGLDRSELRGRRVKGEPRRVLVSSILTWTGGAIMAVGAVLLVP